MLLKNNWIKEEIKGEIKRHIKTNEYDISKLLGYSKSSNKREVYIITGLSQEEAK